MLKLVSFNFDETTMIKSFSYKRIACPDCSGIIQGACLTVADGKQVTPTDDF